MSTPTDIKDKLLKSKMVMLDDILHKDKPTLIDSISVDSSFIFIKQPDKCPHCKSKKILGVEVMGAYTGRLLWECESCESRPLSRVTICELQTLSCATMYV